MTNSEKNDDRMVIDEPDNVDSLDDEQLEEYQEMVEQLGTFPDKVKINSLSMIAEDHAESTKNASIIYDAIRSPLVSKKVSGDRKLPLVYVLDSILKNVKGKYITIIEQDAKDWMQIVHAALSEEKRAKLRKVWNLWKDAGVFSEDSWKEMGNCFGDTSGTDQSSGPVSNAALERAGITWGKDGGLLLMPALRDAMQTILDDLQSDVKDELEKVSLERLASIDPDLLIKIKQTAEDALRNGGAGDTKSQPAADKDVDEVDFLIETRAPETIERSKTWGKVKMDLLKDTNEIVANLQQLVREGSMAETRYTQVEAIGMTGALATAAATAGILTNALQQLQKEGNQGKNSSLAPGASGAAAGVGFRGYFTVDKKLFTNEGLKNKNDAVVAMLYEAGLPFVSSSDGRRFATQLELSKHLDALFKKGQLEKTMARTEERGWYVSDATWSGESESVEAGASSDVAMDTSGPIGSEGEADPSTFTMPADESRDRCVICGINFKMFFDNDNGIYMYQNCREIEVLNDDAAEKESERMLVHVTCWRGLGSPEVLSMDQALQDAMHH